MRAGIVPWLWGWLLLGCMPALGASSLYVLAPATPGCTRPDALPRARHLAMGQDHALAVLHCQRAGGEGTWQRMGQHGDALLLRHLPAQRGEAALYFPANAATPAGKTGRPTGLLWLVMVAGGAMVLWPLLRHGWRGWRRRRAWLVCTGLVRQHAEALRIRRRQLVQPNSYGVEQTGRWRREMMAFSKTVLRPALRARHMGHAWPRLEARVLARIERVACQVPAGSHGTDYTPDMDPIAYEHHCADRLRACGWDARTTPPGGDQGADVIACRGGLRLVVQCKLYRNAVGNDAVQQVAAARLHYHADVAAVVSNADYTASARQLARSNTVFLLHHDELAAFSSRLAQKHGTG